MRIQKGRPVGVKGKGLTITKGGVIIRFPGRGGEMTSKTNKPRLNLLTSFGIELNAAIENGDGESILISEIHENLERGTLLQYLNVELPVNFDISHITDKPDQVDAINYVLHQTAGVFHARERSKLGVHGSGLHFLLGLIFIAIQNQDWVLSDGNSTFEGNPLDSE